MLARRTLTAALLTATLLTGCGGDDAGPQTKEGFIAAADEVCQKLFSEFERAGSTNPDTPREVVDANDELADVYGRLSDQLADVTLPETGAARTQAQGFVASVRAAVPLLENVRTASGRFQQAADDKDSRALATTGTEVRSALDAFRAARANSDLLAVQYGMNFCGNLG